MSNKESLYYLATALKNIINNSKNILSNEQQGIIDGFFTAKHLLKNAIEADQPNRIGLFGGQKRGKTTLINILIGVDLLPVSGKPMSSAVLEIES